MQCLRCSNEAVVGKALCAQCLAKNESKLNVEQSEEWVQEKLRSTRKNIRKIGADQKRLSEEFQGAMTKLAPIIVGIFLLTALAPTLFKAKPLPAPSALPAPETLGDSNGVLSADGGTLGARHAESVRNDSVIGEEGRSPETFLTAEPSLAVSTETPTATPTETPTATPTETPTATPS